MTLCTETWQPIETCPIWPLDSHGYGPTILLFIDGGLGVGFWDRDFMKFYIEYPEGHRAQPSHWMPMPEPPRAIGEKEKTR